MLEYTAIGQKIVKYEEDNEENNPQFPEIEKRQFPILPKEKPNFPKFPERQFPELPNENDEFEGSIKYFSKN